MIYLNKTQGILKLFLNDVEISRKRFRTTADRKKIMNDWTEAFEFVSALSIVYIQVSHYEVEKDEELPDVEILGEKAVKVKKKIWDKVKEEEDEPKVIVRPKAEYSNKRSVYDLL